MKKETKGEEREKIRDAKTLRELAKEYGAIDDEIANLDISSAEQFGKVFSDDVELGSWLSMLAINSPADQKKIANWLTENMPKDAVCAYDGDADINLLGTDWHDKLTTTEAFSVGDDRHYFLGRTEDHNGVPVCDFGWGSFLASALTVAYVLKSDVGKLKAK